ncbi:tRNA (guanine(26)-N(2))-dimethyltransferase isoform X1 [Syzygium oleosum]|uniref:tRNA (guanine(26)-N(2))-dimethyltransferase isoform X1 n=1 Tax=Syzygium oleosum TaxID=219896 RepID=UPI0011D28F70|nr:tRNA (guanine(26)-N(2))-dimethyltransferase isoform X1 [Syzygium oleosum]
MLILSCPPPPPLSNLSPNPRIASPASRRLSPSSSVLLPRHCASHSQRPATERGHEFETGGTFYRRESAVGRDLGVLAAALHRRSGPQLRVLDAMCGCGIRSLRYLLEAGADFVLANDANDDNRGVVARNLARVSGEGRWAVSSNEANRVMTECYLKRDFYDLVDVDSFGSESSYLRSAMNCLKLGGLLYVTSTDGYTSGGHRPHHSLAAYGAYVRPLPYSNEVGLRMLIGGAVREASVLGYRVTPLFSYYSYHGPVFRIMLRLIRGKLLSNRHYEFISYCTKCGHSQSYSWDELSKLSCTCNKEGGSLVVSGPLWTGPLHSVSYLTEMSNMAKQLGWMGNGVGTDLQKLLQLMVDESDPRLPFGYIKLDEVASRAKINSPPLRTMMSALQKRGYAVSRSHIATNAIKTDCPMATCIRIAKEV